MSKHIPDTPSVQSITRPLHLVTRRAWLAQGVTAALMTAPVSRLYALGAPYPAQNPLTSGTLPVEVALREALAQRAVDAAMRAGAQYADARLTTTVQHGYFFGSTVSLGEDQHVGVGVRALVNGYWGFVACPSGDTAQVEQLARNAVVQAKVNGQGALPRTVEFGQIPAAVGTWATPVKIDPFTVPIEEKIAFMRYWMVCAERVGLSVDTLGSRLFFRKQERVVATSEGGRFTQTVFESGGVIRVVSGAMLQKTRGIEFGTGEFMPGFEAVGRGWELFLDADMPARMTGMLDILRTRSDVQKNIKPATIGRYTVVCDGATMAAILESTLGVATQLDRALGYEANASGTSYLDDPVAMLGTFQVASSLVNVTANRSAPTQLATVKWDNEGVAPRDIQLVKDGILMDFQTSREQATWLAPAYAKLGRPVHSNGYAGSEHALRTTLQHMPNLSLEPAVTSPSTRLEDLVANVKDGILIEQGGVSQIDSQVRNGLLQGNLRQIQNGKLGRKLSDGAILFNSLEFWKHVVALGGTPSCVAVPTSQWPFGGDGGGSVLIKGEPSQITSHTVQAVAATISNQALINPNSKA